MQSHIQTKGFQMFLFHKLWVTEINCVREYELQSEAYFSAPWPSDSLALLNYGLPFFPIKCFLSSSLKFHFLRSFSISPIHFILDLPHFLLPYGFTLKHLKSPSLIHYNYIANILESFIINACYSVQIFIQLPHSLITSHYPHSSLYHRSICP